MEIKTIDIQAKEWLHKSAGNSYFSAIVTVNNGLEDQKTIKLPFQYGYETQYLHEALEALKENGLIKTDITALWRFCQENNIILSDTMQHNCTQKEVKQFVS